MQRTDALLALAHQVDDLKSGAKRIIRILENGPRDDREAVTISSSAVLRFARPMERASPEGIDLLIQTGQTADTVRPAQSRKTFCRRLLRPEAGHHCGEGEIGLGCDGCSPILKAA
jgi:hypothetical protein